MLSLPFKSSATKEKFFQRWTRFIANSEIIAKERSVMTRIVLVQQREEIISRNIPGRKNIMQITRKDSQRRKIRSFFGESSLKGKLRKSALYAEDRDILRKIAQRKRKWQTFLNKPRSMQMIFLSQMWSHSFPWMMITPLKLWQSWLILLRKET